MNKEFHVDKHSITFWLGCHVLRHSDIIRACISVLTALNIDVKVAGGPKYCCGTIKDMNVKAATNMGSGTARQFNALGRSQVVSYCPSCQTHMEDFISEVAQTEFDSSHLVPFLYQHKEKLASLLRTPIHRRVALHLHSGFQAKAPINEMAAELIGLIPGLVLVENDGFVPGIHCTTGQVALPKMAMELKASVTSMSTEYKADDLVTIFHSCQRALCIHQGLNGIRIVNFIKLLAESMGVETEADIYGEWRTAGDEASVRRAIGIKKIEQVGDAAFEDLILPELTTVKA